MALSHPPLRFILAVAFGGIALLAALATSLLAGADAARRVEASQRLVLQTAATRVAERLDRDTVARWRDVRVTTRLPLMRRADTAPEIRRDILRHLHETYADYALLAFIGPDGRVVADSLQLLEGQDASGRSFVQAGIVQAGMQGPAVEDVHDALMLAGKLGDGAQLRLLDLAAPVRGADGRLVGVVAAVEAVLARNPQGLAPGDYVRIRVAASGAGMDAPPLARAAEPFFATKEAGKGSGLGLSMAHGFAAQSGGALRIESAPGDGTVVTLWLPEAAPCPVAAAAVG